MVLRGSHASSLPHWLPDVFVSVEVIFFDVWVLEVAADYSKKNRTPVHGNPTRKVPYLVENFALGFIHNEHIHRHFLLLQMSGPLPRARRCSVRKEVRTCDRGWQDGARIQRWGSPT
jgi:hypothetical protein